MRINTVLGAMSARQGSLLAVILLLGIKLTLLAIFGPIFTPDSAGYAGFADLILSHRLDADLLTTAIPVTLHRVIGYPALIAGAKLVAGGHWAWLLVAAQMAASLGATIAVRQTARQFGFGRKAALAIAAAQALSLPLLLDQAILADSLYSSAVTVVVCLLLRPFTDSAAPMRRNAAIAGLLLLLAFLLREATAYVVVGFVPLAAASYRISRSLGRTALIVLLVIGPVILGVQTYKSWNEARIGQRIVTTGAQTTMLQALGLAAQADPTIFDGDSALDVEARNGFHTHEFGEVLAINDRLATRDGWTAPMIAAESFAKYGREWRRHPLAMATIVFDNLRSAQMQLMVRPVASVRDMILWSTGSDGGFDRWIAIRQGKLTELPILILGGLEKLAAMVLFFTFAVATPLRWVGDRNDAAKLAAMTVWMLYFTFFSAYDLVHLELRYMAPVVPASLLVAALQIRWLGGIWAARRSLSHT